MKGRYFMQFDKERLKLTLYSDVRKEFPNTIMDGEFIVVHVDDVEIRISLNSLLAEIKNENVTYRKVLSDYKEILREMIKENKFNVDYHKLYVVIRSKNFGLKEPVNFYRRSLFCDLDLLYVTDYSSVMRFLTIKDKFDKRKITEAVMFNANRVKYEIIKLHPLLEIYTTKLDNDYNCGLLFNLKFMREIKKKVGSNYLIAIPTSSTILIARDFQENIVVLKSLMKDDENPNIVSERVYRYKNGEYSYAD
jgi:hypothetical protein